MTLHEKPLPSESHSIPDIIFYGMIRLIHASRTSELLNETNITELAKKLNDDGVLRAIVTVNKVNPVIKTIMVTKKLHYDERAIYEQIRDRIERHLELPEDQRLKVEQDIVSRVNGYENT